MRDNGKNIPLKWDQLGHYYQDPYIAKAEYLKERSFSSDIDVYKLAEMLYNKDLNTKA